MSRTVSDEEVRSIMEAREREYEEIRLQNARRQFFREMTTVERNMNAYSISQLEIFRDFFNTRSVELYGMNHVNIRLFQIWRALGDRITYLQTHGIQGEP